MESHGPGLPFFSTEDLLLNEKTHIALNWLADEGALEIEVYAPAHVNNSVGAYLCMGTIRYSGPDVKEWIRSIGESKGETNIFMHIRNGTHEREPRTPQQEASLSIAKNDRLQLTYDAAGRTLRIEVWGTRQDGSEARQGSFSIPLTAVIEFLGQVARYEREVSTAMLRSEFPHLSFGGYEK